MKLSEISNPLETLDGVGSAKAKLFSKLNIFTVGDLLSSYPRAYDDKTKLIPLKDFDKYPKVYTICKVTDHQWFGYGKMRTLKICINDSTANACLIAFNRPFLEKSLPVGSIICVHGSFFLKYNSLQSTAFEAERLAYQGNLSDFTKENLPSSGLMPLYALTEGLNQKTFQKTVKEALRLYAKAVDDEIPEKIIEERKLLHKNQALLKIHMPSNIQDIAEAKKTLIYEELYKFEYTLGKRILEHRGKLPALITDEAEFQKKNLSSSTESSASLVKEKEISDEDFKRQLSPKQKNLLERLSFSLTPDQKKVILEMNRDIDTSEDELNTLLNNEEKLNHTPFCMQRLLQADVGAGKTLVAFFICLRVIDYGGQCAFMAPTELLARQHAENAARLLENLGVKVAFLTGNLKAKNRAPLLDALSKGFIDIVIGTHALFSKNVNYKNLQLAVIDEQHKFGVTQRESIIAKGRTTGKTFAHSPNLLMMSATPIPQTLSLTVFGDLDISTIYTMPKGRLPIKTYLSVQGHEQNVYDAVRKELQKGHQAYFVYPRISTQDTEDENTISSDSTKIKGAQEMFTHLAENIFPEYKCALVHGKIDEEKQKQILEDFKQNKIQILAATTVVEVGVDVPNATCMVIEMAARFGLAALHQLRGRTGRSSIQSYCFLIYSKNISESGIERMKALRQNTDGFVIAEEDLKLRGPGEITGTAQSGYLTLGIADLIRDKEVLKIARCDAFKYLSNKAF